ncbi:MAG: ATP-dependent metallopeptidase FtsH/Yme1/Tma family protein, partial [Phycisphaerae bacterium]
MLRGMSGLFARLAAPFGANVAAARSLLRVAADESRDSKPRPKRPNPAKDNNGGGGGGNGGPGAPQPPQSRGLFTMVAVIVLMVLLFMMFSSPDRGERITLAEFKSAYEAGKLSEVTLSDEAVVAKRKADEANATETYVRIPINLANKDLVAAEVNKITDGKVQFRNTSPW